MNDVKFIEIALVDLELCASKVLKVPLIFTISTPFESHDAPLLNDAGIFEIDPEEPV
ncbi:hypothetical protein Vi05172_g8973 [Venturia inaequalis]|nr:hypothetical protein Vi05172_g8973 [Venturia inaequalis]